MNILGGDWITIRRHLEEERAKLIDTLQKPTLDLVETQFVRGSLAAIKSLIDTIDPASTPPEIKDTNLYG